MFRPTCFALCALVFAAAVPARAGEGTPVSQPGILHVDLKGAIRMSLAKNFKIQVTEFEPKISQERLTSAWGTFDPNFTLRAERDYNRDSNGIGLTGLRDDRVLINRRDTVFEGVVEGKTPLGSLYRFGYSSVNVRGPGQLGDAFASGPVASLAQPVLRGFGPDATMREIRIARTNIETSEWDLKMRLIDVVTEVIYAYNELHFAGDNLKVAMRSRELAEQLFQDNSRRAQIGTMSPLDITTARAEVAAREEGVILADRTKRDDEVLLKQLLTQELEPMLDIKVEIDEPPFSSARVDVHSGIADALWLRPDYQQLLLDMKVNKIEIAYQKNQKLPRLDLEGSLEYLGFDQDFISSIGRGFKGDSVAWTAGARFSIPLGNHTAKGDLNAVRLQAAQTLVKLKQLEQQIVVDVEIASGQVISDRARIKSTSEASRLAKESLDAGEQRLRAGTGTTFEVLELQKKLVEAESAEIRARADHNKAVAEFNRKTGRTLRTYNVELK